PAAPARRPHTGARPIQGHHRPGAAAAAPGAATQEQPPHRDSLTGGTGENYFGTSGEITIGVDSPHSRGRLRDKLKAWKAAAQKIGDRLPTGGCRNVWSPWAPRNNRAI